MIRPDFAQHQRSVCQHARQGIVEIQRHCSRELQYAIQLLLQRCVARGSGLCLWRAEWEELQ